MRQIYSVFSNHHARSFIVSGRILSIHPLLLFPRPLKVLQPGHLLNRILQSKMRVNVQGYRDVGMPHQVLRESE